MKVARLNGALLGRKRKLPERAPLLSRPHSGADAAPTPIDRHLPPRDTALAAHPQTDLSYAFQFKTKSTPRRGEADTSRSSFSRTTHAGSDVPPSEADHPHRIRVSLRLDPERHLRLKLLSSFSRRSQQSLLTEALDKLLATAPHGFVGAVLPSRIGDAARPAAAGNQPGTESDGSGT